MSRDKQPEGNSLTCTLTMSLFTVVKQRCQSDNTLMYSVLYMLATGIQVLGRTQPYAMMQLFQDPWSHLPSPCDTDIDDPWSHLPSPCDADIDDPWSHLPAPCDTDIDDRV